MPWERRRAEIARRIAIVVRVEAAVVARAGAADEVVADPEVVAAAVDTAAVMVDQDASFRVKTRKPRFEDRGFFCCCEAGDVYGTRSAIVMTQPSGSSKANSRIP